MYVGVYVCMYVCMYVCYLSDSTESTTARGFTVLKRFVSPFHTYLHTYIHTYSTYSTYIHTYLCKLMNLLWWTSRFTSDFMYTIRLSLLYFSENIPRSANSAFIHTYIHIYYIHTYIRYIHTYILHTYMHTYIHKYIHTYIYTTYIHTYIQYIHTESSVNSMPLKKSCMGKRACSTGLGFACKTLCTIKIRTRMRIITYIHTYIPLVQC